MNIESIITVIVVLIFFAIFFITALWKLFQKAGRPGWAALIPFYSTWTLAKISGKPGWWGLVAALSVTVNARGQQPYSRDSLSITTQVMLALIGLVVFVFWQLIALGVARNFKRSLAFGLLLGVFPIIGYPVLAFGKSKYKPVRFKEKRLTVALIIIVVSLIAIGGVLLSNWYDRADHSAYAKLTSKTYVNSSVKFSFKYPAIATLDTATVDKQATSTSWFETPIVYSSANYQPDPNLAVLANYADLTPFMKICDASAAELLDQIKSSDSCFVTAVNQRYPAAINKYLFANCSQNMASDNATRPQVVCTANYPEQDGVRLTTLYGLRNDTLYFLQLAVIDSVWQSHANLWSRVEASFTY